MRSGKETLVGSLWMTSASTTTFLRRTVQVRMGCGAGMDEAFALAGFLAGDRVCLVISSRSQMQAGHKAGQFIFTHFPL